MHTAFFCVCKTVKIVDDDFVLIVPWADAQLGPRRVGSFEVVGAGEVFKNENYRTVALAK